MHCYMMQSIAHLNKEQLFIISSEQTTRRALEQMISLMDYLCLQVLRALLQS